MNRGTGHMAMRAHGHKEVTPVSMDMVHPHTSRSKPAHCPTHTHSTPFPPTEQHNRRRPTQHTNTPEHPDRAFKPSVSTHAHTCDAAVPPGIRWARADAGEHGRPTVRTRRIRRDLSALGVYKHLSPSPAPQPHAWRSDGGLCHPRSGDGVAPAALLRHTSPSRRQCRKRKVEIPAP